LNAANTNCTFAVADFEELKKKMLNWANRFSIFCFLDNHGYDAGYHSLECVLAAGVKSSCKTGRLQDLQNYIDEKPRYLFGHLSYDLKNNIGFPSAPATTNKTGFDHFFFFEPETIIWLSEKEIKIETEEGADKLYREITGADIDQNDYVAKEINIQQRVQRDEYMEIVRQLKKHILRGDCYEINYCMEFFADAAEIDLVKVYHKLSAASPNPFSALYKLQDKFLICASPERFLKKTGNTILSQPIKGTSTRYRLNEMLDAKSRQELFTSEKDRSENVMVVDLVRNDLSRVCREGSVKVEELFGIYSFPQVHQMISTIKGETKEHISFTEILQATFPMGSMTGAPKHKVMELIDRYEKISRGIFSGALGYITPEKDFDFNVVIRSIMYNAAVKYLSFWAGSGITFYSDAEKEYEECMLKAEAMKLALKE
jgi:para-aminobenzoate synthetase component 1